MLFYTLTVYRLAFGQPRQKDLLEYLHSLLGTDIAAEDLAELQIRLDPSSDQGRAHAVGWMDSHQYAIRRLLRIAY